MATAVAKAGSLEPSVPSSLSHEVPFVGFAQPRARVPLATHFRSTWLNSSLTAMRDRGYFKRYLALLPPEYHAPILESVAGMWLSIDVAVAHYRACDALNLSRRDAWDIGVSVTRKVHGTSLALAIRLAKQAGVTPWTILGQLPRLWDRVWRGGGVAVTSGDRKKRFLELSSGHRGHPVRAVHDARGRARNRRDVLPKGLRERG